MDLLKICYVSLCCLFMVVPTVQNTAFTETIHFVNVTRGPGLGINFTDEFNLAAVDTPTCNDQVRLKTELDAECTASKRQSVSGLCFLDCRCEEGKSSFVLSEKQCTDERKFREGCYFVFGSWTWTNGWTWNSYNDSLQVLYLEDGFGFTGGFNASTSTFRECTIGSTAIYDENGGWKSFTIPSDESVITCFKLRGMWHLSWVIQDLSANNANVIKGRFIKFDITCGSDNSVNGSVQAVEQSSCVVFRVTGNLTHQYNPTTMATTSTPTLQTSNQIPHTSSSIPQTSPAVQTSIEVVQTRTTIGQTNGLTVLASSLTIETSSPTVQTNILTIRASSSTVQTSSSIIQISRPTVHANSPTVPTSSRTIQTSSQTLQISSPTVQTSSLIVQNSSPTALISSVIVQSRTSVIQTKSPILYTSSLTIHTSNSTVLTTAPTMQTRRPTNTTTNVTTESEDLEIGVIVGGTVGGVALIIILTAVSILTISHLKGKRIKRIRIPRDIPMRYNKRIVAPQVV